MSLRATLRKLVWPFSSRRSSVALTEAGAREAAQSGVIPYRVSRRGSTEFLMITSRRSGRWMFPKGGLMSGLTAWESAALEAFEEAGIEGEIDPNPLGSYGNVLNTDPDTRVTIVLYALRVTRELDDWQEKHMRRRQWAGYAEAAALLGDADKISVLDALVRRLSADAPASLPPG